MSISRRIISATLCAAGALTATSLAAPAAAAAVQVAAPCENSGPNGRLCYRYESNNLGASAGFSTDVPDLLSPTRWVFRTDGAGAGTRVANNAGSAHNRSTISCVSIFYNQNYNQGTPGAPSIYLGPDQKHPTLGAVNNNNRSHRIFLGC